MTFKEKLIGMDACKDAVEWVGDRDFQSAWDECERGDWMLWLAQKSGVDIRPLTLAKARCAKLVFHLMKDKRSRDAVEVAEQFGLGNASSEELDAAADAADVAADIASDVAYAAAAAVAYAAAADDVAYAAAADAAHAAAADDVAYAAAADVYAAAAAYTAVDVAAHAVYAAARKEVLKKCADICREVLTNYLIEEK